MSKLNTFAIFGILFLFSVLLGNGLYSSNQVFAQNQTGTENEAEIKADIEQENKCAKDTECENENEINNKLNITSITQTQAEESQTTLKVVKTLRCDVDGVSESFCKDIDAEDAQITVTGNNPDPDNFPGSEEGTLVTLGAGNYKVSESIAIPNGPYDVDATVAYSGDCTQNDDVAEGTISEGETQTCNIDNHITLVD